MLSTIPIDLKLVKQENIDKEILRLSIIAELDAVSLYEQMASLTQNEQVKEVLLDIAKEEKTHIGEFQALLLRLDPEYAPELVAGKKEVMEKEAAMNPRKAFENALADQKLLSRFEEGKPADPTENMSPEDAKKWWEEHNKNKDNFKTAVKLRLGP